MSDKPDALTRMLERLNAPRPDFDLFLWDYNVALPALVEMVEVVKRGSRHSSLDFPKDRDHESLAGVLDGILALWNAIAAKVVDKGDRDEEG